jgi:3-(methylthio)propionyl---CoA ligase
MNGLMMQKSLLISDLIRHAETQHHDGEVVARLTEGGIAHSTWGEVGRRSRRLAQALERIGVNRGDAVATIAWNNLRHLELYFGISGCGAVLHTINPRLHPEQLIYIINAANDRVLFVDLTFVPLIDKVRPLLPKDLRCYAMCGRAQLPPSGAVEWLCFEDLIDGSDDSYQWPELDEKSAASICYTSGTTGNPKGVVYSHRSTVLHAFAVALPDSLNVSSMSAILPVVPMFHVNGWGLPYATAMTGAKLVLPGPKLDGESLHELFETEGVTATAGVPTVWQGLLNYMDASGKKFTTLKSLTIGGSAASSAMIEAFETRYGIEVLHAWGMTETSPLGTGNAPKRKHLGDPAELRRARKLKQGRPVYGVEIEIVDDAGAPLPHDGKAVGELMVRGPWVVDRYLGASESPLRNGWFPTGDVATIDGDGYMQITDRAKDLIKSGGEWISSIDLENAAMTYPDVMAAAVIAARHAKWDERPLLLVVMKPERALDTAAMNAHLTSRVAKWWLPDRIIAVTELPLGATGKVNKLKLRAEYADALIG